jgi:hypothetical protein
MAPPVLPAPKLKSSDGNVKNENASSSRDGFKMPFMPVTAVLSGEFFYKIQNNCTFYYYYLLLAWQNYWMLIG